MKHLFLILFLLQFFSANAQKLVNFETIQCKDPIVYFQIIHNRLISQKIQGDTLTFSIGFTHNCSFDSKEPVFSLKNDSLYLQTNGLSESYAACECYFTMNFILAGMADTIKTMVVDERPLIRSKSKYIDFPKDEPIPKKGIKNKTDKEGRKVGYWIYRNQYGVYSIANYGDGSNYKNHFLWKKTFLDTTKELMSIDLYCPKDTLISINKPQYVKILNEIASENN
ncbi:hypothetical protein [Fluviicola taffensis]|uniref:hypothetical protein n=1 Tax=Fluviicola taffensis TaxID=191579 RepID=UPI0031381A93